MAQTQAVTVRKQVVVDAPIERAFTVFTDRFGDFKPPEHNMLGAPIAETVFEPRVGGGIVDRAADGSECRWARIWPSTRQTGWCSAGISARGGRSRPTRLRPARSRCGSTPSRRPARGSSWSTGTSTGMARMGSNYSRRGGAGGLAFVPGPVRRASEGRPLTCRRSLPAPKSSAWPPSPTPPTQPDSASSGRTWWMGTWTARPTVLLTAAAVPPPYLTAFPGRPRGNAQGDDRIDGPSGRPDRDDGQAEEHSRRLGGAHQVLGSLTSGSTRTERAAPGAA